MYQQKQRQQVVEKWADICEFAETMHAADAKLHGMITDSFDARVNELNRLCACYEIDPASVSADEITQRVKARQAERKLMRRLDKMRWELSSRASV